MAAFGRQRSDTPRELATQIQNFSLQRNHPSRGGSWRDSEFDTDDGKQEGASAFSERPQCLATLLEIDDFLSELQLSKPSLMQLLRDPEIIKELISFALGMPHAHSDNETLDENSEEFLQHALRLEHRSDVAFQTLSSDFVLEVVITDEDLLDHLFSYLDQPRGRRESVHFFRIVVVFLDRYAHDLMLYLRSRDGVIVKMTRVIEDQSIVDLLYKFVDAGITHQWLYEENLLKLLIDGLAEARKSSAVVRRMCFAQVISDVLHFCCRWVSNSMLVSEAMESEAFASMLLEYTTSDGEDRESRLKEGLNIFSIMLQLFSAEASQEEEPPFIRLLSDNAAFFLSILRLSPPSSPTDTTTTTTPPLLFDSHSFASSAGVIAPMFGTLRLQVLDFFCSLIFCGFPVLQAYPIQFFDLFGVCVNLLFTYKWNNILHNVLTKILSGLFECSGDEMLIRMLDSTQLLKRLVAAFNDDTPTGNKGHLLLLCQEALRASQVSTAVAEYTYNTPVWEEFVAGRLNELLAEQEPQQRFEETEDDGFIGYDDIVSSQWPEEHFDEPELTGET